MNTARIDRAYYMHMMLKLEALSTKLDHLLDHIEKPGLPGIFQEKIDLEAMSACWEKYFNRYEHLDPGKWMRGK
ncbi:hypothetical protein LX64_00588 [Chitinophaga skermanii]|uniref:Uncharacterized protein n=1 Tax=Chitinophaga skermanii TaxID=331697 RepID=A0A327R2W9_9BACT|nr:hypothetical protein [Chitinophaga skermanii]RAJ10981.1 hypothetical protein LX64_00588 [Chitinophaga skermanii]